MDRSAGRIDRRLWPVVVLVVGLHAALLAVPVRSMGSSATAAVPGALQVRMIAAPAADAGPAGARPSWSDARTDALLAAAAAAAESAPAPAEPATPAPPAPPGPANASPPLPAVGLVMAGIDSDGDYYPRSLLQQAPAPLASVVIDYPPVENDQGHYHSELTLFIDENGRVVRVRVDGAPLPQPLEEAARRAFTGARFRAGEADGHAVKARIRVAVDFDNRPPGSAP